MNKNYYVVIMAGGIGSRFWPFSRQKYPKQFHDVLGVGKTLLQQTSERFEKICPAENIFVVTNQIYVDLVKEQLPFLTQDQILAEPIGRNTAPCIAYASYKIRERNPDACVIVAPSDHIILKEQEFVDSVLEGMEATSKEDILITLGIKPSRPDTGYGYIQFLEDKKKKLKKVKTFTEKPELEIAKTFIQSGDFVWNAGIFIFNLKSIISSFQQFMPETSEIFEEGTGIYWTAGEQAFINNAYTQTKSQSMDYGIMEKAPNVFVILGDFGWSDLGTWKSLYENMTKNGNGNVIDGNVMIYDTNNTIIKTPKHKLVVVEGLENYIIAEFDDVLMICNKDHEQRVKDFVSDAKNKENGRFI